MHVHQRAAGSSRAGSSMSKVGGCWQSRYFKVSIGCFPVCPTGFDQQKGGFGRHPALFCCIPRPNPHCLHCLAAVGGAAAGLAGLQLGSWGRRETTTIGTERRSANLLPSREETVAGNQDLTAPQLPLGPGCPARTPFQGWANHSRRTCSPCTFFFSNNLEAVCVFCPATDKLQQTPLLDVSNMAMLPGGTASTCPPTAGPREHWALSLRRSYSLHIRCRLLCGRVRPCKTRIRGASAPLAICILQVPWSMACQAQNQKSSQCPHAVEPDAPDAVVQVQSRPKLFLCELKYTEYGRHPLLLMSLFVLFSWQPPEKSPESRSPLGRTDVLLCSQIWTPSDNDPPIHVPHHTAAPPAPHPMTSVRPVEVCNTFLFGLEYSRPWLGEPGVLSRLRIQPALFPGTARHCVQLAMVAPSASIWAERGVHATRLEHPGFSAKVPRGRSGRLLLACFLTRAGGRLSRQGWNGKHPASSYHHHTRSWLFSSLPLLLLHARHRRSELPILSLAHASEALSSKSLVRRRLRAHVSNSTARSSTAQRASQLRNPAQHSSARALSASRTPSTSVGCQTTCGWTCPTQTTPALSPRVLDRINCNPFIPVPRPNVGSDLLVRQDISRGSRCTGI